MAVCGMKGIDLCNNDALKITGVHFWYNREERNERKNLERITKIQNVLKI